MLHIQLPTTDEERLRVLEQLAYQKQLCEDDFEGLPVSLDLLGRAERMQQTFANKLDLHCQATDMRQENMSKYEAVAEELRLYIAHFIQVYLLAVERGEMKQNTLVLYKLEGKAVPDLSSDEAIIEAGKNLIEGERDRVFNGGLPMSNPSIAPISMKHEMFKELVFNKKVKNNYRDLTLSQLEEMRAEVDEFIKKVADELEERASELTDEEKTARYADCGFDSYEEEIVAEPVLEVEKPAETTEIVEEPTTAEVIEVTGLIEETQEIEANKTVQPEKKKRKKTLWQAVLQTIDLFDEPANKEPELEHSEISKEPELELYEASEAVELELDMISEESKQEQAEPIEEVTEFQEVVNDEILPVEDEEFDLDEDFPEYIEEEEHKSEPKDTQTQLSLWD